MAAGDYRIGLFGEFYYGTAGSQAGTEATNVEDVNINLSARMAEALRRKKTYVASKPTYLEATITFTIFDIEGDAFYTALKTAFFGKSKIAAWPLDVAAASGGEGLDADYYVSGFSRVESNPEFVKYNVELKPTDEQRNPTWQ